MKTGTYDFRFGILLTVPRVQSTKLKKKSGCGTNIQYCTGTLPFQPNVRAMVQYSRYFLYFAAVLTQKRTASHNEKWRWHCIVVKCFFSGHHYFLTLVKTPFVKRGMSFMLGKTNLPLPPCCDCYRGRPTFLILLHFRNFLFNLRNHLRVYQDNGMDS